MKKGSERKIKEIFHYFNIDSEIDSVYGNWAVAKSGDVVKRTYFLALVQCPSCEHSAVS